MAIVSCDEMLGQDGGRNEKNEGEYTRKFRVIVGNHLDNAVTILAYAGIPRIGDMYATMGGDVDPAAVCKEVRAAQDDDAWKIWEVEAKFGKATEDTQSQTPQQIQNPLKRPADIGWGFSRHSRSLFRDVDNKPVLNSAGDFFDPPPEIDDSRPVLTISRNEGGFDASRAIEYQDAVNSDSFFGFSPGQVKVASISSQRQIENNIVFWKTTYEFEMRQDKWVPLEILDVGKRATGRVPICMKTSGGDIMQGVHVTEPVPLREGLAINNPSPTNCDFIKVKAYREKSFKSLRLP